MKFIAGNVEFTDNIKQLLPNVNIFDKIISETPSILENKIWRKQIGISSTGISSGSVLSTTNDIFYRSCYLIYKTGNEIVPSNISMIVKNIYTDANCVFDNWGLVLLDDNLYVLYI